MGGLGLEKWLINGDCGRRLGLGSSSGRMSCRVLGFNAGVGESGAIRS